MSDECAGAMFAVAGTIGERDVHGESDRHVLDLYHRDGHPYPARSGNKPGFCALHDQRVWSAAFALIILLNWAVPAYAQSGLVAAVLPASRASSR